MKQIHKKQLLTLCIDFFLVFFIITRQLYSKLPEIASFTILGIFIFFTIIYCIENIFFEAKVDKFYYFICFCFVFGAIWSLIISKDPYPLFCVLYATTFYKANKRQKYKNLLVFTSTIFFLVLILSLFNIIQSNYEPIFDEFYIYEPWKISFGFVTANYTFLIFNLIVLLYFLYKKKFSIITKIFFLLFSSILFVFTRSRTGYFISLMIVISSNLIYKFLKSDIHKVCLIFVCCLIISLILGYNIGGIGEKLNGILNSRPQMWNFYLSSGLKFFGYDYVSYIFVDNYYLHILIIDGLICFIFTMISLFFMCRRIKNKEYIVCIIFILFYFIFENCFRIFIPFISCLIYESIFGVNDSLIKGKSVTQSKTTYYVGG